MMLEGLWPWAYLVVQQVQVARVVGVCCTWGMLSNLTTVHLEGSGLTSDEQGQQDCRAWRGVSGDGSRQKGGVHGA